MLALTGLLLFAGEAWGQGISIYQNPRLHYIEGEPLDLTGLMVKLDDDGEDPIPYFEFENYGISTFPVHDDVLTVTEHNQRPVCLILHKIEYPDICTDNLKVTLPRSISLIPSETPDIYAEYDYSSPSLFVTIMNTGNQPTGDLTVTLDSDEHFTLNTTTNSQDEEGGEIYISSIEDGGGTAVFSITPKAGLPADTYTATVTVSGGKGIWASIDVSFTVNPKPVKVEITVDTPVKAEPASSTISEHNGYGYTLNDGSEVLWSPALSPTKPFRGGETYTASVRLELENGNYTFDGMDATINGLTAEVESYGDYAFIKFTFPRTTLATVIYISIESPPELTYEVGDLLDLSGLEVYLEFDDGTTDNVSFDNFETYGITTDPEHNTTLWKENDGKPVTVWCNDLPVDTNPLTVTVIPYSIILDITEIYTFPSLQFGYDEHEPEPLTVTVLNTGDRPTGDLTVTLDPEGSFTLNTTTISSIKDGDTDEFTVTPKAGLPARTHTATVTVSGDNIVSRSFDVSFKVDPLPVQAEITIDAPVTGQSPNSTIITNSGHGYSLFGGISWSPSSNDVFLVNTAYIASIWLQLNANFTFSGSTVNINGLTASLVWNLGNYAFFQATFPPITVTNISIVSQPEKLIYTVGDALDLWGLEADLSFNDGTTIYDVPVADFGIYGITTNPGHNAILSVVDNGKKIEVLCDGTNEYTEPLTVTPANPEPVIVDAVIIIDGPVTGQTPNSTILSYNGYEYSTISEVSWDPLSPVFLSNTEYTASVELELTDTNYSFDYLNASINGITASVSYLRNGSVRVEATFPPTAMVDNITIVSQPEKLDYTVGDELDLSGLVVNLEFNDGTPDINVSLADFEKYGITTNPGNGAILTADDDDKPVEVSCDDATKETDRLTVSTTSYGISLDITKPHTFPPLEFDYYDDALEALTVTVSNTGNEPTGPLTVKLSKIYSGSFVLSAPDITDNIPSIAVGGDYKFTVTPNTGLPAGIYTEAVTVSGGNGILESFIVSFTVEHQPVQAFIVVTPPETGIAPNYEVVSSNGETIYKIINNAVSWSPEVPLSEVFLGDKEYTASVYLELENKNYTFDGMTATINGFEAEVTQAKLSRSDDNVTISYQFAKTTAATVNGISIQNQPANLIYFHGNTLNLSGLTVNLIYNDGTVKNIPFANFEANDITTSPAHGDPLTLLDHGLPVTVTYNDSRSAQTVPLTVTAIPVTTAAIHVTAPVPDISPDESAPASGADYTCSTVTWDPYDESFIDGKTYTATVTLTADPGYTFLGLTNATINLFPANIDDNDGATLTISYQFTLNKTDQDQLIIVDPDTKTYGDDAFQLYTTGGSGDGAITFYLVSGSSGSVTSDGMVTISGAGDIIVYAIKAGDATYKDIISDNFRITVYKKTLTITGLSADDKIYDGTDKASYTGTASLDGVIGSDRDNLILVMGTASFADKDVGEGKTVTFSGFILVPGGASGNYTLEQPPDGTADITEKELTIDGITANDKVYDGSDEASYSGIAGLIGVISGDDLFLSDGTATFDDKHVGEDKTVTFTGFSLTGKDAGNYALKQPTEAVAEITALPLVWNDDGEASDKVYDGNTDAYITTHPTLGNVVPGDDVDVDNGVASFDTKDAGIGKIVTFTGYSLSGADAGNYSYDQPPVGTADITAIELTITGLTAYHKVYDGSDVASFDGTPGLSGVIITDDVVSLDEDYGAASFDDKHVGTGKTVTFSGFSLTGQDAGNYALLQPTGTADITALPLVWNDDGKASDKVYDGNTDAYITTHPTPGNVVPGDEVIDVPGAASFNTKDAENGKIVTFTGYSLSGTDEGNYSYDQPPVGTADITVKDLTITGLTANNKVYDGSDVASYITGTAVLNGLISGDDLNFSDGTATFNDKNVGTGKTVTFSGFTLTGADKDNYSLQAQPANTTASITEKSLAIKGFDISKVFDDTNIVKNGFGALIFDGLANGESANVNISGVSAIYSAPIVGTHLITFTGNFSMWGGTADPGNYVITQPTGITGIIIHAIVTYPTAETNLVYNGTMQTGVKGGAGYSISVNTGADAEDYTATVLLLSGYRWSDDGLPGTSTIKWKISPKPLTITGFNITKPYDGDKNVKDGFGALSFVGLAGGEYAEVNTSGISATYSDNTVTNVLPHDITFSGNLFGMTGSTAKPGNYVITQPTGITGRITRRPVTITGLSAQDKVYDGTTTVNISGTATLVVTGTTGVSGKVGSEDVTVVPGSAAFVDKNAGTKTVKFSNYSLDGADKGNYELSQPADVTAVITARPITITGVKAENRVYDGTTKVDITGGTLEGVLPADALWVIPVIPSSGSITNANVSNNKPVTIDNIGLGRREAGNYTLIQPSGITVDILKASVNPPIAEERLIYTGSPQTGVVNDSRYIVANGRATDAGEYTATVTLRDAVNYKWSDDESNPARTIPWSIAKASRPAIVWPTVFDVIYDPDLKLSWVPFSGGSTILGEFSWSAPATPLTTAGTTIQQMTLTLNDFANNYDFPTATVTGNVSVTVNRATSTVTLNSLTSIVHPGTGYPPKYGDDPFSINHEMFVTTTSSAPIKFRQINVDDPPVIDIDQETGMITILRAGTAQIEAYVDQNQNYEAAISTTYRRLSIGSANLLIMVDNYKLQKDKTIPDFFPYRYLGFINGDDVEILEGEIKFDTKPFSDTRSYIYAYGVTADNYTIICSPGMLEITEQPLLYATVEPVIRPYGNTNPTFTIKYEGFENGHDPNTYIVKTPPVVTCDATSRTLPNPNGVDIIVEGGQDDYYSIQPVWSKLTVTKARMRVKAHDKTRREGQANPELTFEFINSDFRFNHTSSIFDETPEPCVDAYIDSPHGIYEIYFTGGENDPRYTFEPVPGGNLYILPAEKVVDYGDPPFDLPLSPDVLWTDTKGILDISVDDNGKVMASILQGGSTSVEIEGTPFEIPITVNKATLYVSVNDTSRIQGAANPVFEIRYKGFRYGDNKSIFDDNPFIAECDARPSHQPSSSFAIRIMGGPGSNHPNYQFEISTGRLEILPGDQLPTAFSPNGDHINEVWPWENSNYEIKIFNRLGTLIYSGKREWDGRYNGRLVAPDIYHYIAISAPDETGNGGGVVYKGTVEVVRTR